MIGRPRWKKFAQNSFIHYKLHSISDVLVTSSYHRFLNFVFASLASFSFISFSSFSQQSYLPAFLHAQYIGLSTITSSSGNFPVTRAIYIFSTWWFTKSFWNFVASSWDFERRSKPDVSLSSLCSAMGISNIKFYIICLNAYNKFAHSPFRFSLSQALCCTYSFRKHGPN